MLITTAHYRSANGQKYMQQLCKHFAHKVDVQFDDTSGRVDLLTGPVTLAADSEGMTVRIEAEDAKTLIQARYVIDSHLVTFAFREGFTGLDWRLVDGQP